MPPYNPYPDPFDFRPARQQQPAPGPTLPDDESTILGRLMESSLGGLSYVGKILDKTFGGRAVRGVLGGRPQELLSVLPMSDTLGLTREQDTVHGKDLLQQAGLITPGDNGWENDLAGVGAEIALDPAMWFGAAVPKLVAKGLQGTGRGIGAATEAVTGGRVNPYTYGARQIDRVADPLVRTGRSLFDTSVAETRTREVQPLAQDVFTPQLRAGRQAADEFAADAVVRQKGPGDAYLARPSRPVPYRQPTQDDVRWAMTQAGEGFAPEARQSLAQMGFAPGEADDLVRLAEQVADRGRGVAAAERNTGVVSRDLVDVPGWQLDANRAVMDAHQAAGGVGPVNLPFSMDGPAQYVPRTAIPLEQPGAFGRAQRDRLSGMSEFQEARDDFLRGIPGGTKSLNDLTKNPLTATAERETVHGVSDLQVEHNLMQMLTGHGSGPKPAAWTFPGSDEAWAGARQQAKELSDYLKALPPERLEKGLFNPDLIGNVRAREMESVRTVASGETVLEGIKRFAQPIPVLQQAKQPHVPVEEILNKIGLTHPDPMGGTVAQQRLLGMPEIQSLGVSTANDIKGLAVTKDVADDMLRMGQAWRTPESLQPVLGMWDRVSSWFKGSLTSPFPAFHVRNVISGMFNMWRDGAANPTAADSVQHLVRGGTLGPEVAGKLYPGLSQAEADQQILKELLANSPAWRRQGGATETVAPVRSDFPLAEQLPKVGGTPNAIAEDVGTFLKGYVPEKGKVGEQLNPLRTRGVLEEQSQFLPVKQGEAAQGTAEKWIQGTHYLAKRLEGATPADAKLSMLKYQIDYADMTQFEQHVMKRLFPWYSFSRKNLPPILEDLAERPAKLAATTRVATGTREPGEFVPPWVAEGAAAPVPGAPEGQKRFVASFGLPFEDELVKTIGSGLHGDYQRVLQQMFGMGMPLAKLPAELATGTQMFSGRKLEDLRPYEMAGLGGLLPEDTARQASQVIANTPASRLVNTVDKFADERKGTMPTLLNTLTGVRVQDVDVEKVQERAAQKLLQDLLRGQPGVKAREEVYVPKDQMEKLDPNALMEYDLLKEIERRSAQRARERERERKKASAP